MGYAGGRKYLTFASFVLSAVSALVALIPFWYILKTIKEALDVSPDADRQEALNALEAVR